MTAAHGSSEPSAAEDGEIEPASVTTRPALSPSSSAELGAHVLAGWSGVCALCGGTLMPLAGMGRPHDFRAISTVQCAFCGRRFVVMVTVVHAPELGASRPKHPAGCPCPSCRHRRQRVCVNGHPLTDDNVYVTPGGRRQCRTCHPHSGEGSGWARRPA